MPNTARTQHRYDHRLRNLVQRTGDVSVATHLGVPRSTARGWLGAASTVVLCLDVADLTEPELRQEVLKLRRRVRKLTAPLRLVLALLHTSGFRLNAGPSMSRVLRPGAQPGPSACGVSRPDAGRDVPRHRSHGASRPEGTRGRRTSGSRQGQPIGVVRDMPDSRRSCMTIACLIAVPTAGTPRTPCVWRRSQEKQGPAGAR